MIKILKTDLFRLFKSKAFYVYPIVVVIIMMIGMLFSVNTDTKEEIVDDEQGGVVIKVYDPDADTENVNNKYIFFGPTTIFESLYDGLTLMFLGIVLIIFSTCETRNGFVKNAVGCAVDRRYMPLSKMIIGVVIMVIYVIENIVITFIFNLLEALISGKSLKYQSLPDGDGSKFFGYLFMCILVHLAIIALLSFIHELTFSRALGIVLTVGLTTGLLEECAHGAVYLINYFFHILEGFNIGKYLLFENIAKGYNSENFHPEILPFMALIYLTIGALLAVKISQKKDVR